MSDLISRQAAIEKTDCLYRDTKNDEAFMITGYNHALSDMRAILKSLPSVQEQRWIPVTERLPEEGLVIVACGKDGNALYVASADAVRESAYEGYVKAWMQIEPWKREEYETD